MYPEANRISFESRRLGLLVVLTMTLAWSGALGAATPQGITEFGSNPGNLQMLLFVPDGLPPGSPLLVALHGCGQTAREYAHITSWLDFAEVRGFAVLLPETNRRNNPESCFRWFDRAQGSRGSGEALSVVQMIDRVQRDHRIDPGRVYVTGFSAGGAMTAALLATYPERFAAGSILAGVPFRCATNAFAALGCMKGLGTNRRPDEWARRVREASSHQGPWPRVLLWHGSHDRVVSVRNGAALTTQWTAIHETNAETESTVKGHTRRVFTNPDGKPVVVSYLLSGMGHSVSIDPGSGRGQCGTPGPHTAAVGICSTYESAKFFGLVEE